MGNRLLIIALKHLIRVFQKIYIWVHPNVCYSNLDIYRYNFMKKDSIYYLIYVDILQLGSCIQRFFTQLWYLMCLLLCTLVLMLHCKEYSTRTYLQPCFIQQPHISVIVFLYYTSRNLFCTYFFHSTGVLNDRYKIDLCQKSFLYRCQQCYSKKEI